MVRSPEDTALTTPLQHFVQFELCANLLFFIFGDRSIKFPNGHMKLVLSSRHHCDNLSAAVTTVTVSWTKQYSVLVCAQNFEKQRPR